MLRERESFSECLSVLLLTASYLLVLVWLSLMAGSSLSREFLTDMAEGLQEGMWCQHSLITCTQDSITCTRQGGGSTEHIIRHTPLSMQLLWDTAVCT